MKSLFSLVAACAIIAGNHGVLSAQEAPPIKAPDKALPAVFGKKTPDSVEELKLIQDHVEKLVEKVTPTVVSLRIGNNSGSGVVVSKDGYILTAGHVSGEANRDVTIFFHDGKKAQGKTLGANQGIDSGMIKITTKNENGWPFAEMGDSAKLKPGDWCMVISHPGGFKPGRTPPVRLGRMTRHEAKISTITTDCILVGGDSGGPLFDMHGQVIGINSRIANAINVNMHVSVNPFRENWDKLANGEVWGKPGIKGPFIGLTTAAQGNNLVVQKVAPGSPADKAGVMVNDIVLRFADKDVGSPEALSKMVQARKAGDQVVLEVRRGDETLKLNIEIGKR